MDMGSITDYYEFDTCAKVDEVKKQELDSVDFDSVVYENSKYEVVPTIVLALSGEPVVKYGIYNKETCVMEADASQLITAKGWANALEQAATDPDQTGLQELPGLGNKSGDGSVH